MPGALGATRWTVQRSLVCQSCTHESTTSSSHNLVHAVVREPGTVNVLGDEWTNLLRQALLEQPFEHCRRCPNRRGHSRKNTTAQYPMGCPANLIIALHQGHASTSAIPSSLDMAVFIETSDSPVALWYDLVGVVHGRSATSRNAVAYTRRPGGTWTGYYNNGRVGENLSDYDVLTARAAVLRYAKRGETLGSRRRLRWTATPVCHLFLCGARKTGTGVFVFLEQAGLRSKQVMVWSIRVRRDFGV
ncbi:unnamed protein product [Ectocarpus sp. 12 AP-2014]